VEAVSGYPTSDLNASDETGAGLDFVDQASVVIADVIDSATDRSRNYRTSWRWPKEVFRFLFGQGLRDKPARKVRLFENDGHSVMDLLGLLTCRCRHDGSGFVQSLPLF
jgi:hypothetical protein